MMMHVIKLKKIFPWRSPRGSQQEKSKIVPPHPLLPKKPQEKKKKEKGICLRPHITAVSWLLLTLFKTFFLGGKPFLFLLFWEMEGGNFRFGTFINHQKGGRGEIFCALPLPPLFSQIKMNWRTRRKKRRRGKIKVELIFFAQCQYNETFCWV